MKYQDFKRLYHDDPVIFHLGMELFEEQGQNALLGSTDQALCTAVGRKLSNFFAEGRIMDVIKAARDFAGVKTIDRLTYAALCGIKLEDKPIDEPGVCPLCDGVLRYGALEITDELRTQDWTCENCGATGKEAYQMVFDCHYYVTDREGKLAGRPNRNK